MKPTITCGDTSIEISDLENKSINDVLMITNFFQKEKEPLLTINYKLINQSQIQINDQLILEGEFFENT